MTSRSTRSRLWLITLFGVVALVVAMVVGLGVGPLALSWWHIIGDVGSHLGLGHSRLDSLESTVLWQLRAPRLALGLLVGAMLSVAAARTRGSFVIRWPTPTSSAWPPAPA